MTITPLLSVKNLAKTYPGPNKTRKPIVKDVSLDLAPGEFVSVIGPSGCGKSTLFQILTGLLNPDQGSVVYHGTEAQGRYSAYMPQKDLLFPWLTAQDNACLGLTLGGMSKAAAREKVNSLMSTFRLDGYADAYPFELSGGMRQRVALLRTMVLERPIMLLDEPFGALDYLTRTELQLWLSQVCSDLGLSTVLITHDVPEALLLSDRVYVLSNRPAEVRLVLELPDARPRTLDYMETPEFSHNERLLLEELTQSGAR
ncbi:ABC transporter [Rhodococcus sp. KBW08]|uniref:ABC transporter ATP-binding protein n=1 Tax=Rhodococcus TaxID=1827 RepID=UPI000F599028|nr:MULTISPECIES: ABC transporter ATP-binding protein [Rhodococcus]MDJ0012232.1 ABC transporter ATP-binding protein [Rhodococcus erythropolis]MDJ0105295.1 ABC transporter ATP-binding protein [Rhodococcus erythropolis]RQO46823.1 ABC transporter [Rhodococcus sp. KBW08]